MTYKPCPLYSQLPAIDRLLREPQITPFVEQYGQTLVTATLRGMQEQARIYIKQHQALPDWCDNWALALGQQLEQKQTLVKASVQSQWYGDSYQSWPSINGRIGY